VGGREWLWRTGHRHRQMEGVPAEADPAFHPAGAWWWRFAGEAGWRLIAGRPPRPAPRPEFRHHVCVYSAAALRAGAHLPDGEEGGAG
jgi:hypothetical protein